jgi:2-oxoglutaroyl-CoA hydrolase
MSDPPPLLPTLPESFDGFRLELDRERQRADVILDRPPLNIVTMAEREELRAVFEALDADARIRVVVLRAAGEHFSSGGEISGFLAASPEHVSRLAWNIGAPARCRKPVIAASRGYCFGVGFELALACDFRIVSETCLYSLPVHLAHSEGTIAPAAPKGCLRMPARPQKLSGSDIGTAVYPAAAQLGS